FEAGEKDAKARALTNFSQPLWRSLGVQVNFVQSLTCYLCKGIVKKYLRVMTFCVKMGLRG
ncbi:MAG: hypothetical protein WCF65_08690, partial [Parachlamydiaceae bacterium]